MKVNKLLLSFFFISVSVCSTGANEEAGTTGSTLDSRISEGASDIFGVDKDASDGWNHFWKKAEDIVDERMSEETLELKQYYDDDVYDWVGWWKRMPGVIARTMAKDAGKSFLPPIPAMPGERQNISRDAGAKSEVDKSDQPDKVNGVDDEDEEWWRRMPAAMARTTRRIERVANDTSQTKKKLEQRFFTELGDSLREEDTTRSQSQYVPEFRVFSDMKVEARERGDKNGTMTQDNLFFDVGDYLKEQKFTDSQKQLLVEFDEFAKTRRVATKEDNKEQEKMRNASHGINNKYRCREERAWRGEEAEYACLFIFLSPKRPENLMTISTDEQNEMLREFQEFFRKRRLVEVQRHFLSEFEDFAKTKVLISEKIEEGTSNVQEEFFSEFGKFLDKEQLFSKFEEEMRMINVTAVPGYFLSAVGLELLKKKKKNDENESDISPSERKLFAQFEEYSEGRQDMDLNLKYNAEFEEFLKAKLARNITEGHVENDDLLLELRSFSKTVRQTNVLHRFFAGFAKFLRRKFDRDLLKKIYHDFSRERRSVDDVEESLEKRSFSEFAANMMKEQGFSRDAQRQLDLNYDRIRKKESTEETIQPHVDDSYTIPPRRSLLLSMEHPMWMEAEKNKNKNKEGFKTSWTSWLLIPSKNADKEDVEDVDVDDAEKEEEDEGRREQKSLEEMDLKSRWTRTAGEEEEDVTGDGPSHVKQLYHEEGILSESTSETTSAVGKRSHPINYPTRDEYYMLDELGVLDEWRVWYEKVEAATNVSQRYIAEFGLFLRRKLPSEIAEPDPPPPFFIALGDYLRDLQDLGMRRRVTRDMLLYLDYKEFLKIKVRGGYVAKGVEEDSFDFGEYLKGSNVTDVEKRFLVELEEFVISDVAQTKTGNTDNKFISEFEDFLERRQSTDGEKQMSLEFQEFFRRRRINELPQYLSSEYKKFAKAPKGQIEQTSTDDAKERFFSQLQGFLKTDKLTEVTGQYLSLVRFDTKEENNSIHVLNSTAQQLYLQYEEFLKRDRDISIRQPFLSEFEEFLDRRTTNKEEDSFLEFRNFLRKTNRVRATADFFSFFRNFLTNKLNHIGLCRNAKLKCHLVPKEEPAFFDFDNYYSRLRTKEVQSTSKGKLFFDEFVAHVESEDDRGVTNMPDARRQHYTDYDNFLKKELVTNSKNQLLYQLKEFLKDKMEAKTEKITTVTTVLYNKSNNEESNIDSSQVDNSKGKENSNKNNSEKESSYSATSKTELPPGLAGRRITRTTKERDV